MSAFSELCKDGAALTLDLVTLPYRGPAHIYNDFRTKGVSTSGPSNPMNPSMAAMASGSIELVKMIPGLFGFIVSPEVGVASMVASNAVLNVVSAPTSFMFDNDPILPRTAQRNNLRRSATPGVAG